MTSDELEVIFSLPFTNAKSMADADFVDKVQNRFNDELVGICEK